jgi:hypothetical protein
MPRRFAELGAGVVIAAALIVVGVLTLGSHSNAGREGATVSQTSTGPTPFPDSWRIPADMYAKAGTSVNFTPADPSAQPQGSIVSQQTAEDAAKQYGGPGTTVYGAGLANVTGLSSPAPSGLYWIVSIDPGNRSARYAPSGNYALNFVNVFVSAKTGATADIVGSSNPAYSPFANSANDAVESPGSSGLTVN